ncbi:ribosome silencing factor [Desulfovibrio sp. OttesenSCG-928-G15]|nr:ribosome silencing factor [Desulfovibrio sp. OttesenSCG-928-G15]
MRTPEHTYSTAPFTDKAAAFVEWLSDKKAKDIVAFDLSRENSLSEAVVIATANSVRHGQGLAEHVLKTAREQKYEYLRMEGATVGQWILLDFNDVIVHIFQPDTRSLFRLDDLWAKAPVLADMREES